MSSANTVSTNRTSWLVPLLAGLLFLAVMVWGLLQPVRGRVQIGEPAPDFTLSLLDGDEISLESLRGQVVVLNFWASWCGPCRQEAPILEQVWQDYQGKIVLLGIAHNDTPEQMREFVLQYEVTYPNGLDVQGKITRAYGVAALPETFVVDREGIVQAYFIGGLDSSEALVSSIEGLLTASP